MKRIFYFGKKYKYDILATIFALILFSIASQQASFFGSIIVILFYLIIIIFLRFREKDFYFIPLTQRKDKDGWIGMGEFDYLKMYKCFSITKSETGYIYTKCLTWSDYKYSFNFKIINTCVGAIVRAVNLSNYIMLQINANGIRPHIRINGAWRKWEHEESNLSIERTLSFDKWYKCSIFSEKENLNIKIYDGKKTIFDRGWTIPTGNFIFQFKGEENGSSQINIPFSINLEYGSVGFRNCGHEKALIKNVLIKKI